MTLYLPTEVARKLSFYCMDRDCDVNGVVAEAVQNHVTPVSGVPAAPVSRFRLDRDAVDSLIERSRHRLASVWALRPWAF
jgi:hypothetical protein